MPPNPALYTGHAVTEATLTEADRAAIKEAILNAYPYLDELFGLILAKWGVRVRDHLYTGDAGTVVVDKLVEWAKGQGRTCEMLSLAWTEKHRQHRPLQDLAERLFPVPEEEVRKYAAGDALVAAAVTGSDALAIAATAKTSVPGPALFPTPIDQHPFAALLARMQASTCVVEIDQNPRSTGFLIGRRTVITAYNGVAEAIEQGLTGEAIGLRFGRGGTGPETVLRAAPGFAWRGPFSPYSQADVGGAGDPEPGELDFAVVFLDSDIISPLQALALPGAVPIVVPDDPMIIAQNPMGGALQVGAGRLVGYSAGGERLHYEANTAAGSSGAPVFSASGDLIAVHHAARMVGGRRIGQGVPIWPIRQAILAAGLRLEDL